MSGFTDEQLRDLFRDAPSDGGEVDAEQVWRAVRGELPQSELEAVIDRCAADPDTALAWRLAADLSPEVHEAPAQLPEPANDPGFRRGLPRRFWAPVALMAAAVLLLLLAPPLLREPPVESPTLRSGDTALELGEVEVVRRGEPLTLSWAGAPDGTRYTVTVTDTALVPLYRADGIGRPEATVPAAVTASWTASTVLWKVEGVTAEGQPVQSAVARVRVE